MCPREANTPTTHALNAVLYPEEGRASAVSAESVTFEVWVSNPEPVDVAGFVERERV